MMLTATIKIRSHLGVTNGKTRTLFSVNTTIHSRWR